MDRSNAHENVPPKIGHCVHRVPLLQIDGSLISRELRGQDSFLSSPIAVFDLTKSGPRVPFPWTPAILKAAAPRERAPGRAFWRLLTQDSRIWSWSPISLPMSMGEVM